MMHSSNAINSSNKLSFFVKAIIIALALSLISGWLVYRDTTTPTRLSSESFSKMTLAESIQKIADTTVAGGAPGIVVLVRKDGIETVATAGVANKLIGNKMLESQPLRIASVSKVYTATVIFSLANKGLIDLDANITNYIDFNLVDGVPNAKHATVRQLLLHTSGIPDYYDLRSYFLQDWSQPLTLARTLPVAKRGSASFSPGEKFEYSNMGYILLGEIAESVSGDTFNNLIDRIIKKPLELNNTYYNVQHPTGNGIHGYGTIMRPWADTYELWEHSGPDGGVMATASETAKFIEALTFDDGELKGIGSQMLEEAVPSGKRHNQGLGLETITTKKGTKLIGHTGDVFGYQTVAFSIPESKSVFVAHINCDCTALSAALIGNIYRAIASHQ